MQQPNNHLRASIKALQSKLRRIPAYQRGGRHQIATRHCKDALMLLDRNEDAALDHFTTAAHAAEPYTVGS